MPLLGEALDNNHLRIQQSPGDGHCLFHSFVTSWNNQYGRRRQDLTYEQIVNDSVSEFRCNTDFYGTFLNTDVNPPHRQLELYVHSKVYDQPIGDIYPYVLANAFDINLGIIDEHDGGNCTITIVSPRSGAVVETIFLHKINNNHYNGLVLNNVYKAPLPSESCRTYSRDDLLSFNSCGNIKRSDRKRLFRLNIWRPAADRVQPEPTETDKTDKSKQQQTRGVINRGHLKIGSINPCSACNKALLIRDFIEDEELDVLAVTETFQLNDSVVAELLPPGYNIVYHLRSDGRRGGGVALIYRQGLKCCTLNSYSLKTLEAITVRVTLPRKTLNISVVYAPECKVSITASRSFIEEFSPILYDDLCGLNNLLILGDFNYHVNKEDNAAAKCFLNLLDSCGLHQHVCIPTHIKGNTLDLVITRENELQPRGIFTNTSVSPDHYAVIFDLPENNVVQTERTLTSRKWKNLNDTEFKSDILDSDILQVTESDNVSDALGIYDRVLRSLVDKHAPVYQGTCRDNQTAPWYNDNIRHVKRLR